MSAPLWLHAAMFVALCAGILSGFPVAFVLAGTALAFAGLGGLLGYFDAAFLGFLPSRIFGLMNNQVLLAIPLFVFMGVMLERSRVAETLLESMAGALGGLRGGLGVSVVLVGALLAASTGIVGATVVTMGLLALPALTRAGYPAALACGTVASAGSLGQIIPPSIVLVVLGDQISSAHQAAQRALGNFAPEPVSVGDLFAGALAPGAILVVLYVLYQVLGPGGRGTSIRPRAQGPAGPGASRRLIMTLLAPIALMVAVLGSILMGAATPTEAAAIGAVGALLLAGARGGGRRMYVAAAIGICMVLAVTAGLDLRLGRAAPSAAERFGALVAGGGLVLVAMAVGHAVWSLARHGALQDAMRATVRLSAMIFMIVIAAQLYALVFRAFGGDARVHELLGDLPGGGATAMLAVMVLIFALGFILDFIEITFIVVPVVGPVLLQMGFDPVWLGVMIALNLQTSFLTPPFGLALFYLRGVAPAQIATAQIYRGVVPFVLLQLLALGVVAAVPALATWHR